ncbi:hypothetical protein C4K20_1397 [Pseudomonas chlororaphis subsp. aurantiaca]|nr:hypothetical protein C4K20_1397 [Pseudomonas chlororaphis subsp. aurantiaca]AZD71771.1 hypothetical protein C4K16_1394 [Pseudomonas chlororaphis subsp. aurantiaca]
MLRFCEDCVGMPPTSIAASLRSAAATGLRGSGSAPMV